LFVLLLPVARVGSPASALSPRVRVAAWWLRSFAFVAFRCRVAFALVFFARSLVLCLVDACSGLPLFALFAFCCCLLLRLDSRCCALRSICSLLLPVITFVRLFVTAVARAVRWIYAVAVAFMCLLFFVALVTFLLILFALLVALLPSSFAHAFGFATFVALRAVAALLRLPVCCTAHNAVNVPRLPFVLRCSFALPLRVVPLTRVRPPVIGWIAIRCRCVRSPDFVYPRCCRCCCLSDLYAMMRSFFLPLPFAFSFVARFRCMITPLRVVAVRLRLDLRCVPCIRVAVPRCVASALTRAFAVDALFATVALLLFAFRCVTVAVARLVRCYALPLRCLPRICARALFARSLLPFLLSLCVATLRVNVMITFCRSC